MRALHVACLSASVLLTLALSAQGFNRRYDAFGQGYAQGAYGLERSADGYTIFNFSYEPDTVAPDSFLTAYSIILQHIDEQGALQWERRYHRPLHLEFLGWADCCDTVPDGGLVVGGGSKNIDDVDEARLVRFNAQGDSLWSRTFGGEGEYWIGRQVKHLAGGGFVICGATDATGYQDGFLIKTDGEGQELWRHTYGWEDPVYIDGFTAVIESVDGDLYTSGTRNVSFDDGQHWVQRTDVNGILKWRVSWGGQHSEGATYVGLFSDGHPLIAGGTGYGDEVRRPYLAKLDTADGDRIWEHEYGPAMYTTLFFAAKECPNSDLIACGVSYEGGWEQGLLLRATGEGDSLWMRRYASYTEESDSCEGRFWDVLPTNDGGFIASGFANLPYEFPFPPGVSQDAWVVKVDAMGCIVAGCDGVGVPTIITNMSNALSVYPNPVHAELHVAIALPAKFKTEGALTLSVTSLDGKLVQQQQVPTSAIGEVLLDVSSLAAGTYSVHLSDERTWIAGRKIVVE